MNQVEEDKIKVIEGIVDALPGDIFPDTLPKPTPETGTEETLSAMYGALTDALNITRKEKSYYNFVESMSEITKGFSDACSGPGETRLRAKDFPNIVKRYINSRGDPDGLKEFREAFGQVVCIDSTTSRMKRQVMPKCDATVTCPAGGIAAATDPCEFFRCLDPNDDIKPLFGLTLSLGQTLAFVLDTTESMFDEIEAAKQVITGLISGEEDLANAYVVEEFNDYGNPSDIRSKFPSCSNCFH